MADALSLLDGWRNALQILGALSRGKWFAEAEKKAAAEFVGHETARREMIALLEWLGIDAAPVIAIWVDPDPVRIPDALICIEKARARLPHQAPPPETLCPKWDLARKLLTYGSDTLLSYGRRAPQQFAVLDALQSAGWPADGIKLPNGLNRQQAKDAIAALNEDLAATLLRFSCAKTEVGWCLFWNISAC